ncbi:hypothetical protein NE237_025713 [Protea cynaroides]|uniref:Uncharacterized protein n=1 Tax=Protea cynaroides TaxID=273540 RepID=A0A9Q0H6R6_9MAGN|nr:hypothetical protein NE237_025713 [Protea cynaroides]
MGSASPSRRVLRSDIAAKEDEQNDVSSDVEESNNSYHEDDQNIRDVDPNEVRTINGSGCGQVTFAELGTVVVSYNEVEKLDNVLAGHLDSFDVVRPTRGRLKKMAAKGGGRLPLTPGSGVIGEGNGYGRGLASARAVFAPVLPSVNSVENMISSDLRDIISKSLENLLPNMVVEITRQASELMQGNNGFPLSS